MKLKKLLELKLIEKIDKNKYKCLICQKIGNNRSMPTHYFYNHEDSGAQMKETLRIKAIESHNKPEMKKIISENTKKAFQREEVKAKHKKFSERMKIERKGKGNPFYGGKHTEEWKIKHSETMTGFKHTIESREKMREASLGKKHKPESIEKMREIKLGKKASSETKLKMSKAGMGHTRTKLTAKKIKRKYPFFYKIEKPRDTEDGKIEVQCKNCGKWFIPSRDILVARIYDLENPDGVDGSYYYCSKKCKSSCILYGLNPAFEINKNYKDTEIPYTDSEINTWRTEVLRRTVNGLCQDCKKELAVLVHHIKPRKLEPLLALDPDNGAALCQECHDKKHAKGTEHSTGALANKICSEKINAEIK